MVRNLNFQIFRAIRVQYLDGVECLNGSYGNDFDLNTTCISYFRLYTVLPQVFGRLISLPYLFCSIYYPMLSLRIAG